MTGIEYDKARQILENNFEAVETDFLNGSIPAVPDIVENAFAVLFNSKTQAYREVLLGCILARLQDKSVNIRLPYINQGNNAYNGRTLDERVVNPFLQSRKIPCSKGPFLSCFRRSVKFDNSTREGLRDKEGYDAFLELLSYLEAEDYKGSLKILRFLLYRFIKLREETAIDLFRIKRISIEQCDRLISDLIEVQSGGRFPLFLIVSTFRVLNEIFDLDWTIEFQGINVADKAAGAGGDITIINAGQVVMAAEVTERPVDRQRVVSTFDTKIAPKAIEDYLFFIKNLDQAKTAVEQARRYFSQGHEVNFLEIKNWIVTLLSILGIKGRELFMNEMVSFLDDVAIQKSLKVAWNNIITRIASVTVN